MLYLYTLMMFAWHLDNDTHAYFRKYLDIFIKKRKISKVIHSLNQGLQSEVQERAFRKRSPDLMPTSLFRFCLHNHSIATGGGNKLILTPPKIKYNFNHIPINEIFPSQYEFTEDEIRYLKWRNGVEPNQGQLLAGVQVPAPPLRSHIAICRGYLARRKKD